jgi:hypothetical protein
MSYITDFIKSVELQKQDPREFIDKEFSKILRSNPFDQIVLKIQRDSFGKFLKVICISFQTNGITQVTSDKRLDKTIDNQAIVPIELSPSDSYNLIFILNYYFKASPYTDYDGEDLVSDEIIIKRFRRFLN